VASDDRGAADALERRVASLEASVRAMTIEILRLKSEARERGTTPPEPPPTAAAAPHPMAPRSPLTLPPELRPSSWLPAKMDLESLVGRYGTLVLATISALAAVGTFLGWAIANGLLGPTQRIALGLIVAVGLTVGGLRLRRRERSFGASLLGLALAITMVCAWGAGPLLHIVPNWAAFLLAAITSVALAIFAHAENDEPLWCVGFSGAAITPFVTSSGKSDLAALAAYGMVVLALSGYAMGARRWMVAGRLFLLVALVYTATLAMGSESRGGPLLALGFPLAVALGGVVPWTAGWGRRDRLRALGSLSALGGVRAAIGMNLPFEHSTVTAMIATAGVVWLVLVDRTRSVADAPPHGRRQYEGDWLDAGVLPMGFAVASIMALDGSARASGLGFAVAGLVLLLATIRFPQGSLRDAAAFVTVLCALMVTLFLARGQPLVIAKTIAGISALCFAANVLWRSVSWTTLGTIGLAWAVLASVGQLTNRIAYEYTPFATRESAVAAVVLASIIVAWRLAREPNVELTLRAGVVVWAFIWVHQEIAFAVNPTVATLLRVTYYAATSVAAVGIGRARSIALLRHVGLALAVLAAGTALYGARNLESVGARIGADLVAAVFLLAIAYWYRRPGNGEGGQGKGLATTAGTGERTG
jgi:hypothetical protein